MSIPPLVCNTPPPPDQCDDAVEPEDFDLHYNLSQDEEENYDYGNFPTYFQSSTVNDIKTELPILNTGIDTEIEINNYGVSNEIKRSDEFDHDSVSKENKFDEDNNLEDLNLQLDEMHVTNVIDEKDETLEEANTNNDTLDIIDKEKMTHIANINTEDDDVKISRSSPSNEYSNSTTFLNNLEEPRPFDDVQCEIKDITTESILPDNKKFSVTSNSVTQSMDDKQQVLNDNDKSMLSKLDNSDDFGEFDDFQSVNYDTKSATILNNCDNPWTDKEDIEISNDLGDFKANFEEEYCNKISLQTESKNEHSNIFNEKVIEQNEHNDDFGDFDDFKSSTEETNTNEAVQESSPFMSMLNLQSSESDHQFIGNINKVLTSIFEEDIQSSKSEFELKLESFLCETWGHLMDTDLRQPYMITWNNSLGQKSLLKALCIDSRNILFGPKWNANMPKYAANMTSAPLQPQKQSTSSNVSQSEIINSDKTCNKPITNWIDPFTSDGQESCNTENENTATETRSRELDIFESATVPKADNIPIYSDTLNIQPLRQISLPDTHIFTPTDSETPRSKTIHYDSAPSVLVPLPVLEGSPQLETISQPPNYVGINLQNEDDYSDFQDFKGTETINTLPSTVNRDEGNKNTISNNTTLTTNIAYQTQLLQPIKEPIIPTVNWPDPGEVKEVFDDFSSFVSNSSWNTEKKNTSIATYIESNDIFRDSDKISAIHRISKETVSNERSITKVTDEFDDEFDTFQSALPSNKENKLDLNNEMTIHNEDEFVLPNVPSNPVSQLDFDFPSINNTMSETPSFKNERQSDILKQNNIPLTTCIIDNVSRSNEVVTKNSPIQFSAISNVLQPAPVSIIPIQNHQKSGQILQPLSLESYSQINWPNPGIDLQDLSKFNPVETLNSLKGDISVNSHSKTASPIHSQNTSHNQVSDDDIWGEFVSSKPKQQHSQPKKTPVFSDDDEWTDFVSSPIVKPQNGLNTISLNVHTNLNIKKSGNHSKLNQMPIDIPTLNYINPNSNNIKPYSDRHFQNL